MRSTAIQRDARGPGDASARSVLDQRNADGSTGAHGRWPGIRAFSARDVINTAQRGPVGVLLHPRRAAPTRRETQHDERDQPAGALRS
jgi:hypothetical protein